MIGAILNAVMQECRALLADTGGEVILKTDYKNSNLPSYTMPLLIVDLLDAPDTMQYPNGRSRVDWNFALNSYANMPDPLIDDNSGSSMELLNVIDRIRIHFSAGFWKTDAMYTVQTTYCFKFTLTGISPADALNEEGLVIGYKINFDGIAIDSDTDATVLSDQPLQHVTQVN
jgi:hypothetical protein